MRSSVTLTSSPAAIPASERTAALIGKMKPPDFCGKIEVRQVTPLIVAETRTDPNPRREPAAVEAKRISTA